MYKQSDYTTDDSAEGVETVFIVDDDEAVRDSLQWMIEPEGYRVVAYEDPEQFLEELHWPIKAVVCLDVRMPKLSGLEVQDLLRARGVSLPIIFITGHGDVNLAVETMKKGASDFLEKPFDEDHIKTLIANNMQKARTLYDSTRANAHVDTLYAKLTGRELQVLERIEAGRLNKQIADDLNISIKTVEAHRANIMEKLEVKTMAALLKLTLMHKNPEGS